MTRLDLTLTRPLILLPAIACLLVVVAGIAAPAAATGVAPAGPVPVAKMPVARDRTCDSCGVIESIRRTDTATGRAAYKFTVRMRDGSTRDSSEASRGRWLEGDQMLLIGGTAARAVEQKKNAAR